MAQLPNEQPKFFYVLIEFSAHTYVYKETHAYMQRHKIQLFNTHIILQTYLEQGQLCFIKLSSIQCTLPDSDIYFCCLLETADVA